MNNLVNNQINKFFLKKLIIKKEIISSAFGIQCEKFILDTGEIYIAKYYLIKPSNFNSIISETKSLDFFYKKFPRLFPSVRFSSDQVLIMDYIENNKKKNKDYQTLLLNEIIKIHSITGEKFGFDFASQIGGLKQPNEFNNDWVEFFREKRLNMVFEEISSTNLMPLFINQKIEKLIKELHNLIPQKPTARLLHGDLWEGNIFFNNGQLVGLIDPGVYYGHNELEISYLTWFNFVNDTFLKKYSNIINIEKSYKKYEPIYQLYFSLLNVHLWSRAYIKDTELLLNSIDY
jgi:fructosamine-3-kinase